MKTGRWLLAALGFFLCGCASQQKYQGEMSVSFATAKALGVSDAYLTEPLIGPKHFKHKTVPSDLLVSYAMTSNNAVTQEAVAVTLINRSDAACERYMADSISRALHQIHSPLAKPSAFLYVADLRGERL